ncbi:MAG TPA: sensor histidine kinase [Steroidobacteraceae bacterium]|nr:sensor histidine kinase [Steroidobacteraceae bacterium]
MRLSSFIKQNLEPILADWVEFAAQQLPAAAGLDERALRDHGKLILQEIAADMERPQNDHDRQEKSEGNSTTASAASDVPSRSHARQRERQGFEVEQMVAEYRALRATVLRLWGASSTMAGAEDLEDVIRFNEAVDQATAESLSVFLAEMDKTRDLFLGMMSHDLRGPLSTIANCARIEQKTRSDESPTAAIVLRSIAQMKALLDDLIEYTRNRLGNGLAISPAPLHLETFVRDTLKEIEAISAGHVLELVVQGDTKGEWDGPRLHQALSNLVFNALKYGHPGSAIRVSLDGRRAEEVVLAVENAGKPIPAELLTRIFDPLVRAGGTYSDAASHESGANLGLGLYVVREIAAAHRGTIEVSSNDSVTRFELHLPRICVRRTGDQRSS